MSYREENVAAQVQGSDLRCVHRRVRAQMVSPGLAEIEKRERERGKRERQPLSSWVVSYR